MNFYDMKKTSLDDMVNMRLLFFKFLKNWKWYVALLLLGFLIAHEYSKRKPNIYELKTLITVKDENNPFFTNNMSLVFNWGGVSDKVNTIITTFKSRAHNEKIVKKLKYYIRYFEKGKYFDIDIYDRVPFEVIPDPGRNQMIHVPFEVTFIDSNHFRLRYKTGDTLQKAFNYLTETSQNLLVPKQFEHTYKTGENIDEPFFHGKIVLKPGMKPVLNKKYFFKFLDFHQTVNHYRNLYVDVYKKNTSMIELKLKGKNKKKIQDYLNTSVRVLQDKLLQDKNSFASNTLKFIDSTLQKLRTELAVSGKKLEEFQKGKKELVLDNPAQNLYEQLLELDAQKSSLRSKKIYYQSLLRYLSGNQLSQIPSPSIVGIDDPLIVENTKRLTELSIQREQMEKVLNPQSIPLQELDREIQNVKTALENAIRSALKNINAQESLIQNKINRLEQKLGSLPGKIKKYIDLKRDYEIKDEIYSYLLQKRNEVNIVKASNQSTIKVIDDAKDIGQAPVAPNRTMNYIIAFILALLLPSLVILFSTLMDHTIHDVEELKKITPIRILGTIFHNTSKFDLPVLEKQSGYGIREAFSTLRTNLRLQLPKNKTSKTIIVTSTTAGEGKTFISTNLAAINALSKQKTILLEFDLRKPKSHKYFIEVDKTKSGITSFFSNEELNPEDIIQHTRLENLDFIIAGRSMPENEDLSALLESKKILELFDYLKSHYDYIIIDSPPLGLVPDALILYPYADYMLYIVREGYSKKNYLEDINEYYKNGEIKKVGIVYNDYKVDILKKYGYKSKYTYVDKYKYAYGGLPNTVLNRLKSFIKKLFKSNE